MTELPSLTSLAQLCLTLTCSVPTASENTGEMGMANSRHGKHGVFTILEKHGEFCWQGFLKIILLKNKIQEQYCAQL